MLLPAALGLFYIGGCCIVTAYFQAARKRKMVLYEKFLFLFWLLVVLSTFIYGALFVVLNFFQISDQIIKSVFSFIYIIYGVQLVVAPLYLILKLTSNKWLIGLMSFAAIFFSGRMLFTHIVGSELIWRWYGEPYLASREGPIATYQVALNIFISILLCFLVLWLDFKRGITSWRNLSVFYSHSSLIIFATIYLIRLFYFYMNPWFQLLFHLLPPYFMYLSRKHEPG